MRDRAKASPLMKKEYRDFWIFISPWIVGFIAFSVGPIIASIFISLTEWNILSPPNWVGFNNFINISKDNVFYTALLNTAYYTVGSVILGTILALIVAILLNQHIRGITIFRTLYFLPSVTAGVAVTILWLWIYNPEFGLANYFLSLLGIRGPQWLFDTRWALPALIIMSLWGIGSNMIIFLAALQNVPQELLEAAEIDGADSLRRFWHVTIPMISPTLFLVLVMSMIGAFQTFMQPYVMTRGGPGNATMLYGLYIYFNAFQWWKMGYASALSWIMFIIVFILTLLQFKLSKSWVYYETSEGR